MDTIADRIVYQVAFFNILLFRNLVTLLEIFNIALVISSDVALLLISDFLHKLLHVIAHLFHSTFSLTPPDSV